MTPRTGVASSSHRRPCCERRDCEEVLSHLGARQFREMPEVLPEYAMALADPTESREMAAPVHFVLQST